MILTQDICFEHDEVYYKLHTLKIVNNVEEDFIEDVHTLLNQISLQDMMNLFQECQKISLLMNYVYG